MKKLSVLILSATLAIFALLAIGATTQTNNQVAGAGFVSNTCVADASGGQALKAGVSGKAIYLEKIYISSESAVTYEFGGGQSATGVTETMIGPIFCAANSNTYFEFTRPVMISGGTAFAVDASAAANATFIVQGYIK